MKTLRNVRSVEIPVLLSFFMLNVSTANSASVKVKYDGTVIYTRLFRMRATFSTSIGNYPYDSQNAELTIASTDYSSSKVKIVTDRWNQLNGIRHGGHWLQLVLNKFAKCFTVYRSF